MLVVFQRSILTNKNTIKSIVIKENIGAYCCCSKENSAFTGMDLSTDRRIPAALSNDENKILEENVDNKMKELTAIHLSIDENIDRSQMLEDHQKVLEEELGVLHVVDTTIAC